jgi:hypothetical protein
MYFRLPRSGTSQQTGCHGLMGEAVFKTSQVCIVVLLDAYHACYMLIMPAGSTNGAVKLWGYGSGPFQVPSLLRQLRKKASGSQGGSLPHAKVVRLALSSSGKVLWTAGKETISLWVARSKCADVGGWDT